MSAAHKGKRFIFSPEGLASIRAASALRRGVKTQPCPEERKIRISEAQKGKPKNISPEGRARLIQSRTGRIVSAETRAKRSAALKGKTHKGYTWTEEGKKRASQHRKERRDSEESKEKRRESCRSIVTTGKHNNTILICVDGIMDSISAVCGRIGAERHAFKRWLDRGLTPQAIADSYRTSGRYRVAT